MLNTKEQKRLEKLNSIYVNQRISNISVYRCFLASVSDYHEFKSMKFHFSLVGLSYEYEEVGCFGREYHAVFWVGDKPEEYINLLKKSYGY